MDPYLGSLNRLKLKNDNGVKVFVVESSRVQPKRILCESLVSRLSKVEDFFSLSPEKKKIVFFKILKFLLFYFLPSPWPPLLCMFAQ